jgi:hypothetical protein
MTISSISDDHHFVKHCRNREVIREGETIIGVQPWAFELRPPSRDFPQEKTLSGVYYEFFDGDDQDKFRACYHFIKMEIKRKDVLVRMNAGLIREQGRKRSARLRVNHEPDNDCLAYAVIRGLPEKADDELCALLASLAVVETLEASRIISG